MARTEEKRLSEPGRSSEAVKSGKVQPPGPTGHAALTNGQALGKVTVCGVPNLAASLPKQAPAAPVLNDSTGAKGHTV